MKLVLVTGMSGAGKSVALKTLEDAGFEAIDNIPLALLPAVASSGAYTRNLAVGADIRSRDFSAELFLQIAEQLKNYPGLEFHIVFLESDDEVLRRRFTETRRRHPLALDRPVLDGIQLERQKMAGLRDVADVVIDTSELENAELLMQINAHFASDARALSNVLTSFSFKRGVPRESDMVFDVRFLKNPYYDDELKPLSGFDERVEDYIESDPGFSGFFESMTGLITPLLPRFVEEGKHYLTLAVGCTGGQHRSVYVVQKLGAFLKQLGYNVAIRHRDL